MDGSELEGARLPPSVDRSRFEIILGDFVTQDQGTALSISLPATAQEDYELAMRYGLPIMAPVDRRGGKFTAEAGDLKGEPVFKADPIIIQKLTSTARCSKKKSSTHSYPHCWRCKQAGDLSRHRAVVHLDGDETACARGARAPSIKVNWIPPWGEDASAACSRAAPRLVYFAPAFLGRADSSGLLPNMQRAVLTHELCDHVAAIFEKEGSDAWYIRPVERVVCRQISNARNAAAADFTREEDILDVWFDSGVSWASVVEQDPRLRRPSRHLPRRQRPAPRLVSHGATDLLGDAWPRAYESVLTHGFTLDGKGRKMSKSLGNVIAPQEIMKKSGAEILRLWVAAEDFREDVRISDEILNRLVEAYRRLRNTARFLISNLYDFEPDKDAVQTAQLDEMDRWILQRTQNVLSRCREAYDNYEFHAVYHTLNNFCSVDLSAQYLDIVKDRLYCEGTRSKTRRAAQTTLYRILDTLVHLMAPILSFTAEEIWDYMPDKERRAGECFSLAHSRARCESGDAQLADKWDRIFRERSEVLKALEQARAGGIIGHSLDAKVLFESRNGDQQLDFNGPCSKRSNRLQDLVDCFTSGFPWRFSGATASRGIGVRCYYFELPDPGAQSGRREMQRCWKYDPQWARTPISDRLCPLRVECSMPEKRLECENGSSSALG